MRLKYFDFYVVRATHPDQKVWGANDRQGKRHFAKENKIGTKTLCNMIVRYVEEQFNWDSPMIYIRKPRHGAGETCGNCWNLSPKIERKNTGEDL